MRKHRLLIVDDEPIGRSGLATLFTYEGYELAEAADAEDALAKLASFHPDVVLCDVRMDKLDGIGLLKAARERGQDALFVMTTAHASIELAVEAMKLGAENCLTKPLKVDVVRLALRRALEKRALAREPATLKERVQQRFRVASLIGDAPAVQSVLKVVQQAAPTTATLLILGESGTGKELIAQALHEASPRRAHPFVAVSCAALGESVLESELFGHEKGSFTGALARREGRFERANGGTLFLDEIGDLSGSIQVKLLRVLESQEFERVGGTEPVRVDVRLVAATNRDLAADVRAGRFRGDLYYRLNVVAVTLPPLRDRKGDLPALVSHFISRYSQSYDKPVRGLAPGTLQSLLNHDWPGNVRELENAVERAVVLCRGTDLTTDDLPPSLRCPHSRESTQSLIPGASWAAIERQAIWQTLEMVGGSTTKAARILGISVRKIQYRLSEYGHDAVSSLPQLQPVDGGVTRSRFAADVRPT